MKRLVSLWINSSLEEKILWLYIALMPLSGIAYFMLGIKRIGYQDFVFIVLFIIWLIKYRRGETKFSTASLGLPFIFMLGLFLLSFINSINLFNSFIELLGLIYLMTLFLLVINIISTPQKLRSLLTVFLGIATVVSLVSLFYFCLALVTGNVKDNPFLYYSTIESMAHHLPRIKLTLETPNMMLTYLHTALIIGIILLLSARTAKNKLFIFLSIVIISLAAFFTCSRRFTGLLSSLFLILCWFGKGRVAYLIKYVSFLAFIFFLIVSIITSIWVVFPVKIISDKIAKTATLKLNYKYSLHLIQPVASINMFKKHPIIGIGFGTYNRHFKENVDWGWLRSSFGFEAYPNYLGAIENKTLIFDPHSVFLGTLAETGLAGFLGLFYFFLSFMRLMIKGFKKKNYDTFTRVVSGCVLAGFIGFLLNGLTIDILSMRHFWFMAAIGLACYKNN